MARWKKDDQKYWDADIDELEKDVNQYSSNGYSCKGIVDPTLPAAIKQLKKLNE